MTYPPLGALLNRTPRELAQAYDEAFETLEWLARAKGRAREYHEALALCSRIRFAFDARVAANGIEPRKAKR